jgi:intracellular septation protein
MALLADASSISPGGRTEPFGPAPTIAGAANSPRRPSVSAQLQALIRMKILADFFPILLFFITFKLYDIYAATIVAIVATAVQVAYVWFRTRRVEPTHIITLVLIIVFGGATLYFKDEMFIKWKPTVVNWLFGLAFLLSQLFGSRTLIERMLGGKISLPPPVWRRLNLMWVLFFIVLGGVNVFVLYTVDTATWVNFKLFGLLGLTFLFVLLQSIYLARYAPEQDKE